MGVKICSAAAKMDSDAYREPQRSSIDIIASALEPVELSAGALSSPDGAVTLMLSDIADAGAVAEQLGPEQWACVLRDQRALAQRVVAAHDGRLVKVEQDGFLASFASAHAALHAAIDLQRTFTGSTSASNERAVAVRIGLHSGFVLGNPDQLLGRNVVLASRIADRAHGGEILVSSTLKQYTDTDASFQFEPHGEYHFKGVLGEHTVYSVRWR
jgi:class 3 adenylate cyclase